MRHNRSTVAEVRTKTPGVPADPHPGAGSIVEAGDEGPRKPAGRPPPAVRSWLAWGALIGGIAVVIMAFFLSIYRVRNFTVPLGWDTSRYLWRTALARMTGIANMQSGVPSPVRADPARPGFIVVAGTLGALGHVSLFRMAAVLPSVTAAAIGLAAGGFITSTLRRPALDLAVVALAVGMSVFVVRLVGPETYQDNLFAAAVFFAAAIPAAWSLRDRRALLPAILLFAAGGLIHWAFFAVMLATLAVVGVAYLPESWRSWRLGELGLLATPTARMGEIAAGGTALTFLTVFGVLSTTTRSPALDPSEFAKKLRQDQPKYKFPITLPVAALGAASLIGSARRDREDPGRSRFVLTFLLSWCAVSLAGYLAFKVLRLHLPAHRFLAFALALPVLGALAIMWAGRLLSRFGRAVGIAVVVAAVGASAFLAHVEWYKTPAWMDPVKIQQAATAAAYLEAARVPVSRPVVYILVDRDSNYVALMGHMIRAAIPAQRLRQTYIYAGSPDDYVAARPTPGPSGAPSGISRRYFTNMRRTYGHDPVAVILNSYNDLYFHAWVVAHPGSIAGPGVAVVRGPILAMPVQGASVPLGRLSVLKAGALAVGSFAVLWLIGSGWTVALLGRWLRRGELMAVAPAVGIAALVAGGVVMDRLAIRLAGIGGAVIPVVVAALGWGVTASLRRNARGPTGDAPAVAAT